MKLTNVFKKKDKVDEVIDDLVNTLVGMNVHDEGYEIVLRQLERVYVLKNRIKKLDPNTVAVVGGNLVGILLILNHEKLNVITTKALGFVIKGRV